MRMYLKADYHRRLKKKMVKDTWNQGQKKKTKGQREDINNPINTEQSQIHNLKKNN